MKNLIVILGVGRSGTSLLQSMIGAHPSVVSIPETSFIRRYICSIKNSFKKDISKNEVFNFLESDKRLKRLDQKLDKVFSNLTPPKKNVTSTFLDIYRELLKSNLSSDHKMICDKDPKLIEFIPVVTKIPCKKIILLIRDPRDVLLSKKKAKWSRGRPSVMHIITGLIQFELFIASQNLENKDLIYTILYEDLLDNPSKSLTELCNFLEIEFDKTMLNFGHYSEHLVSDDEYSWKKETLGPLLTNNTNKWEGNLKNWEVAIIERLSGNIFTKGKYKKSNIFSDLDIFTKSGVSIFCFFIYIFKPCIIILFKLRNKWISKKILS